MVCEHRKILQWSIRGKKLIKDYGYLMPNNKFSALAVTNDNKNLFIGCVFSF
jgi:hypothetical protein